ncbi:MAG: hypothetical protein ABSD31_00715 [Candidatus Binataceae bacterium]
MKAQNLNLDTWKSGWGDPNALKRMAAEITAFNKRLIAEGSNCKRRDLLEIQNALNTLAIAIGHVERAVTERITVLKRGDSRWELI